MASSIIGCPITDLDTPALLVDLNAMDRIEPHTHVPNAHASTTWRWRLRMCWIRMAHGGAK